MVPVVEVFAMHIDSTHVTNINPNIRALGLEPTKRNAPKAIRLCKFVSSIEIATEFGLLYSKNLIYFFKKKTFGKQEFAHRRQQKVNPRP